MKPECGVAGEAKPVALVLASAREGCWMGGVVDGRVEESDIWREKLRG